MGSIYFMFAALDAQSKNLIYYRKGSEFSAVLWRFLAHQRGPSWNPGEGQKNVRSWLTPGRDIIYNEPILLSKHNIFKIGQPSNRC